jgi:hypothetical protein
MAELDDNLDDEIRRQVKEQFDRRIEIPDGLTKDEAVAYAGLTAPTRARPPTR